MPLAEGHRLAGRVSGDSTVAFAWAYAQAAESRLGVACRRARPGCARCCSSASAWPTTSATSARSATTAALAFGLAQFLRLREDWLRTSAAVFGHRLLMDRDRAGRGRGRSSRRAGWRTCARSARDRAPRCAACASIYDEHAGLQDRFLTTGIVTPELAAQLGLTGLAARASGSAARPARRLPGPPYDQIAVKAALELRGDVAARVAVRFDEILESLRLIRVLVDDMPDGPVRVDLPRSREPGFGVGWVEGWRGDVLVAVEADAEGRLLRCHCHDPSWQNWPLLEHAVIGNIVPDFPLINKSFNLSYSGQDL